MLRKISVWFLLLLCLFEIYELQTIIGKTESSIKINNQIKIIYVKKKQKILKRLVVILKVI